MAPNHAQSVRTYQCVRTEIDAELLRIAQARFGRPDVIARPRSPRPARAGGCQLPRRRATRASAADDEGLETALGARMSGCLSRPRPPLPRFAARAERLQRWAEERAAGAVQLDRGRRIRGASSASVADCEPPGPCARLAPQHPKCGTPQPERHWRCRRPSRPTKRRCSRPCYVARRKKARGRRPKSFPSS
jgi:hypothetical protein